MDVKFTACACLQGEQPFIPIECGTVVMIEYPPSGPVLHTVLHKQDCPVYTTAIAEVEARKGGV